jgi:preprotein translocase subunit SecE
VAESNRRGDGAAAEHVEDVFDDAVDDDALIEDEDESTRSKSPAKTKTATKAVKREERRGFIGWLANIPRRIWLFFREVIGELRKVIWPTRKDLLTYTAVVVVFVAIIMTLVGLLDLVYAKGVLYVFGK